MVSVDLGRGPGGCPGRRVTPVEAGFTQIVVIGLVADEQRGWVTGWIEAS